MKENITQRGDLLAFTTTINSRRKLRNYVFRCILILLVIVIISRYFQETELCRESQTGFNHDITIALFEIQFSKSGYGYYKQGVETIVFSRDETVLIRKEIESSQNTHLVGVFEVQEKLNAFHKIKSSENKPPQEFFHLEGRAEENKKTIKNTTSEASGNDYSLITKNACAIRSESEGKIEFFENTTSGFGLKNTTHLWRERINERISKILRNALPATHSSFISGVVFGGLDNLPQNRQEEFQIIGLTHVLVASGYNVLLVSTTIILLFQKIAPYRSRRVIALIAVWVYAFLTGVTAPIARASLMATLGLFSELKGRPSSNNWVFVLTLLLLLAISPLFILNISFQLSVLATAAVIWGTPIVQRIMSSSFKTVATSNFGIVITVVIETFSATFCALLFTSPLIIFHFGRLSVIALIANIVLLPFVPILMALGSLLIMLGIMHPFLAKMLGIGVSGVVFVFFEMVHFFSLPQWASVSVTVSGLQLTTYYVVLAVVVYVLSKKSK